jgi:chromosome segregation ATPase
MTNSDPRARFLELEQQASEAVQQLDRLRQETQHYGESSHHLGEAAEELKTLVSSIQGMAEELKNLISGLQEAGVPAILERIEALEAQVGEVLTESRDRHASTDNRLDTIDQRVLAFSEDIKTLGSHLNEVEAEFRDGRINTDNRLDAIDQRIPTLLEPVLKVPKYARRCDKFKVPKLATLEA